MPTKQPNPLTETMSVLTAMSRITQTSELTVRQARIFLLIYGDQKVKHTVRGLEVTLGNVPKPSITRAFDRLESAGLIVRKQESEEDKRVIYGATTPAGVVVYSKLLQTARGSA